MKTEIGAVGIIMLINVAAMLMVNSLVGCDKKDDKPYSNYQQTDATVPMPEPAPLPMPEAGSSESKQTVEFIADNWVDGGQQWEQIHKDIQKYEGSFISWEVDVHSIGSHQCVLAFLDELGAYGVVLAGKEKTWNEGVIEDGLPAVRKGHRIKFSGRLAGSTKTESNLPVIYVDEAEIVK